MKSYQTRSERHHQPKKPSKKPSKKAVVSLMSAGMMLAPTAISFVPQQVQAAENQYATQDISGFIEAAMVLLHYPMQLITIDLGSKAATTVKVCICLPKSI